MPRKITRLRQCAKAQKRRGTSVANSCPDGSNSALRRGVKLLIFVAVNVFGSLGWWLGGYAGLVGALLGSGIGSVVGVFAGWKAARVLLE